MTNPDFSLEFIHPDDEQARRNLEAIPGFSTVVKSFLQVGYEQLLHGLSMASKIKLGPNQLPDLYNRLPPICRKLSIDEPEFFLEMNPSPNAYTFGDTRTMVTITSRLVEYLDDDELEAVIAHECGHITCRHVLYHTMASLVLQGADILGILSKLVMPLQLALLYWQRCSELSADRAAAVVLGSSTPVVETMIRLSGGPKSITDKVDINAYAAQAAAYDKLLESKWDKMLQSFSIMQQSHPFAAVRVREILQWTGGEVFDHLTKAMHERVSPMMCPQCHKPVKPDWSFCQYCGTSLKQKGQEEIV